MTNQEPSKASDFNGNFIVMENFNFIIKRFLIWQIWFLQLILFWLISLNVFNIQKVSETCFSNFHIFDITFLILKITRLKPKTIHYREDIKYCDRSRIFEELQNKNFSVDCGDASNGFLEIVVKYVLLKRKFLRT